MCNIKAIYNLEQIKAAIAGLDPKCQNEMITQAMGIVSVAIDMVGTNNKVSPEILLSTMRSQQFRKANEGCV